MKTDKKLVMQEDVIPKLVAYKACMIIRDIQLRKAAEIAHAKAKCERAGIPYTEEEVVEVEGMGRPLTEEEIVAKRLEAEANGGTLLSEEQQAREAEKKEIEKYGRFWIWEGYISENFKAVLLETADQLKRINDEVIEDIEDSILLTSFKGMRSDQVKQVIEKDTQQRVDLELQDAETEEDKAAISEKAKKQKLGRAFLEPHRPDNTRTKCWNFMDDEEDPDHKIKHVLRYKADPRIAYDIDHRVDKILDNLTNIGEHLRQYEQAKWDHLVSSVHEIFVHDFKGLSEKIEKL